MEAKQATLHHELIAQLLDSRIPKTEREHAAAREIERLRQEVAMLRQEYAADTVEIAKLKSRLADVEAINSIDARFGGRLALILECVILDPHGHFDLACQLLEEYKAEWEKVNPSPPTFMGEPMPPERKARLLEMKAKRGNVSANP